MKWANSGRVLAMLAIGALACSGTMQETSGGEGGAPTAGGSCALVNAVGTTCYACLQDKCSAALSVFDDACGSWLQCMCTGGTQSYDPCNGSICQLSDACGAAQSGLFADILGWPNNDAGINQPVCHGCNTQCSGVVISQDCNSECEVNCTGGGSSSGSSSGVAVEDARSSDAPADAMPSRDGPLGDGASE